MPKIQTHPNLAALAAAVRQALRQSNTLRVAATPLLGCALLPTAFGQEAQPDQGAGASLSEIVVSAQRRTESIQNVPYNISALSGASLGEAGISNINGLSQVVVGLNNVDLGPADRGGNSNFTLRGLRTEPPGGGASGAFNQSLTVSPVSTYFGETPVFFHMPLDDIERVEVLRGPQGTLYGSGAQAGTIRFIPKRPSFSGFEGEVWADGSFTQNSPNANGSVHGMLNLPISDSMALRVVAGEDHLAGFIDAVDHVKRDANGTPVPSIPGDLTSGFVLDPVQRGINSSDQAFARAALRWKPLSALDVQFDYVHQRTVMHDSQLISSWGGGPWDSSFGEYPQAVVQTRPGCRYCSTMWGSEPFSQNIDLASLVVSADAGFATITSATSYYDDENQTAFDQTSLYYSIPGSSPYVPYYPYNFYPRLVALENQRAGNKSFIEEVRLVSNAGKYFDYTAGVYYQRQSQTSNLVQTEKGIVAYNAAIGQPNPTTFGDNNYSDIRRTKFQDRAVFGELTYHITDKWQVTGGVRFFSQTFSSDVLVLLPLCGAICAADQVDPAGRQVAVNTSSVSKHVWKANTSYDLTSDLKLYATYSEGFRRGGVSGLPSSGPFASPLYLQTFAPDLAKNYELGIKGTALDKRIRYFADVYLIDLSNFQFNSVGLSGIPGAYNGKSARSQGLELEGQAALTSSLNVNLGYAFTRSYVSKSFDIQDYLPYALVPELGGTGQTGSLFGGAISEGTPLPGVPRHTIAAGADYTFNAASDGWRTVLHLDASYRSHESSTINPSSIYNWEIPSSLILNTRVSMSPDAHWTYQAYINNLTNNIGYSGTVGPQTFPTLYQLRDIGRSRTYGVQVKFRFGN